MSNFPTLDGLNNIEADSGNLTNITCSTFIATSSAQAPTMIAGNSSNNIATTAFVGDAINTATANLVTTDTSQTLTAGATKFFTTNPQSLTAAAPTLNTEYTNKKYVDDQIATAGGAFVTTGGTGTQTITSNKNFTGTNILGDVFSVDQPVKTSITNNTISDTSVKGSIGGESVYHQMRMGGRGFYIGQGVTNSGRQYFGISGSGTPDPDIVMVMTENGVKVQNANVGDTTDYTEALKVVGTARVTDVTTFDVSPVCAVAPTTANQLVPKTYVDTNFLTLGTSQTITGNKTFNASTTRIQGTLLDVFPTTTQLFSTNTSIAGTSFFVNSTTNTIAGTTTYLSSPTLIVNNSVNSFYIDASYNNLVGKETYVNSPYFLINTNCLNFDCRPAQTIIRSPYVAFTNACTSLNINATNTFITGNTDMTGSVVTATTQATADNSTKVATTAYVNNYGNANYMTINTNQNVSGIKTYSTKQVFNAGTACNTYDATGVTDMTLGSNMGNGILNIDAGRIICDTFGARIIPVGGNLQLNNGTFIEPNSSLGYGETPLLNFPNNQTGNFANTGVSGEADSTKQINITILKLWCGNNQSSTFTLTHSLTNGYAIGPSAWQEKIITFTFVDANTGITRYTTTNQATTALFSMPSLGTIVRPDIVFTLDTTILPQAVYNIFAYVRIQNAFGSNVLNTMTWNLGTLPIVTTNNYNTPVDYTFTSRNLYHCFRNTAMCGVYIVNNIATQQNIMTPIHYSITDFTNFMSQPTIAGAVSTPAVTGGTAVGNFTALSVNNADNYYLVYPNYSLILYDTAGWSGTTYINYKNTTLNPVMVAPTTTQRGSSCRIYFDEVELIKY